ncbi:MAG: DUF5060 domain-containing protein [Bacteroidetes bacterium]|nr:DUF5060 domain-containing protein [Bacteroidota bacterium]MDA1120324.1 DUF5060 domain-containing protein [Bacteroidota bacterium]
MNNCRNIYLALTFSIIFSAAYCAPEIVNIRANEDSILQYNKFQLSLDLRASYTNPFDPAEIEIKANFTSPSGKLWVMPGFYNYANWRSLWMVRFSPDEVGQWVYTVSVRDNSGTTTSEQGTFLSLKSNLKGSIKVAPNKRYLQYEDGSAFYGVGFWYNDSYPGFRRGSITGENLDDLKSLGVNFISTYITPLETMGTGVGRYDQDIANRLDMVFEMCEERNLMLSLNLWFHSYLSETVWGGGNVRWQTNPYQLVCDVKDFYRDEKAWSYQENLYRYFIARWGYSRSLALWFVVDEVNGTDGWVSGDSLQAGVWGKKVHDYFKKNDPYGHLTTGTRSGGIKEFWHEGYQTFDLASREIYEAQGFPITKSGTLDSADIHPLTHSYRNYAGQVQKLWAGYNKPAIIGETGWDHTFYEPSMPGYQAQYHNALWVSLATGTAMTPFWWAYSGFMNDNMVTRQLLSIKNFTSEIPFSKLTGVSSGEIVSSKGDGYSIQSDQLTFGWVVNANTDVANSSVSLKNIENGKYKLRIYHTWRGEFVYEEEIEAKRKALNFTVPGLKTRGSHGNYIGQDIAFILEPINP